MGKVTSVSSVKKVQTGWHLFRNRRTLWCMLKESWKGNYRMSFLTSAIIVFGILYVFIPLDFDWVPVVGWIDDGLIIFLMIKRLQSETLRFNRFKAMERRKEV